MIYYVLLVSALALAAAGFLVRRRSGLAGQVMIVTGCLGCLACVGWRVRHTVLQPAPAGPDRGQAVVAYFLANEVLADAGDQHGTILLFFPPERVFDEETVGTYAGTFRRVLRAFPGLEVQMRTLAAPAKAAKAGQFPLSAFQEAAGKTPGLVACVSFAGVPADIEKFQSGAQPGSRFYVFDPWGTTNWLSALRQGVVGGVIVPRPGVRHMAGDEVSGEPSAVFDQLYLRATPENADQIAASLAAGGGSSPTAGQ
jgi:hypothetical protein